MKQVLRFLKARKYTSGWLVLKWQTGLKWDPEENEVAELLCIYRNRESNKILVCTTSRNSNMSDAAA